MKFTVKEVFLYGAKKIIVYCAEDVPTQLRFIDPIEYTRVILANSNGYEFMKNIFIIAGTCENNNSIFYIKDNSPSNEQYEEWWKIGRFHLDMVIFNYHSVQLDAKEIERVIHLSHNVVGRIVEVEIPNIRLEHKSHWLLDKKLSTKSYKSNFILSGNRDVLFQLAYDAKGFMGVKDNEEYNMDYHKHEDMIGTKKDNGLDFFYFYKS